MSQNIQKILEKLSTEQLDKKVVADLLGNPTKFPKELVEKISIETALKYWTGEIDFSDGDCIMNNLYFYWQLNQKFTKKDGFSKLSLNCYEAFDSGEYKRLQDAPQEKPDEKYTKPLIEKILKSTGRI